METSVQSRGELEKKLEHMKRKYAHIQKKLQKSVKQKRVKEHVHKKLAEQALLQLAEGDASPANVVGSRNALETSRDPQSPDSLCIGPLQLDDSVTETSSGHWEGEVKLNRKSGRSKKRRSVSFVLKEDDAKLPVCEDVPADLHKTFQESYKNRGGEVKNIENEQVKLTEDDVKFPIPDYVIAENISSSEKYKDEKDEGHESPKNLAEDVMCVEETQNLSQLPSSDLQCNQRKQLNPVLKEGQGQRCPPSRSGKSKVIIASGMPTEENTSVAAEYESSAINNAAMSFESSAINFSHYKADMGNLNSISNKSILKEHNMLDSTNSTNINSNFSQNSNMELQIGNPYPETFSDPGPRTTRSRRRRRKGSREITVSDISMKDVIQNSQSSQQGDHTWIEGLIYPVEYYVRKTRSMTGRRSSAAHFQNLLPCEFDGLGKINKSRTSNRGRRGQKAVSLQELVASSQSTMNNSLEDSSSNDATVSCVSGTEDTDLASQQAFVISSANESQSNPNGKMKSTQEDVINKLLELKPHDISSQVSNDPAQSLQIEEFEESIQETQMKSQSKPSNQSSESSSNSSSSSGRRHLSLSRHRRVMANSIKGEGNTKLNTNIKTFYEVPNASKLEEQSQFNDEVCKHKPSHQNILQESLNDKEDTESVSKRTLLPELSAEIRSQILSHTINFVLPDSDFVELKLKKVQMSMTQPLPLSSKDDTEGQVTTEITKPCCKDSSRVKDFTASRNLNQKVISPDLSENSHLEELNPVNGQGIHFSLKDESPEELNDVNESMPEESELTDKKRLCMNRQAFGKDTHIFTKPKGGQASQVLRNTTNEESSNIQISKAADKITSEIPKSLKPSCQQSQGVLESQFSQTQHVPDGTPVFPTMGCSPGSPTCEATQPRVELSPASSSEKGTMSFSPQDCSPRNSLKLDGSLSQESYSSRKRFGITDRDGKLEAKKADKEIKVLKIMQPQSDQIAASDKILSEHATSKEAYVESEEDSPTNGVITPPMAGMSGNITHISPFTDVATATPYGKAEIPRCQSQCDPQDVDEQGEETENEVDHGDLDTRETVSRLKFAGCLQHDFQDFPSPIIGMSSCGVTFDDKEVTCLVVYSDNLVVLWVTSDQYQWQIQASWTVLQGEDITCVQVIPCCEENVVILALGGHFQQCPARLLKYNISTGAEHHLDLTISSQQEDILFQDLCLLSLDTVLVQTKNSQQCQQVYKFTISEDFRQATSILMHKSGKGVLSLQRLWGVDDMVVMVLGQELHLWDCKSECILQKFSHPVDSDICSTCLWAWAESGILFMVLGFKPADQNIQPSKLMAPCVLLALNPATGKSATLHQYELPGTSQDSQTWFTEGAVAQSMLAAETSDGNILIWDLYSAQLLNKTVCPVANLKAFNWTLTQDSDALLTSQGSCIHMHTFT